MTFRYLEIFDCFFEFCYSGITFSIIGIKVRIRRRGEGFKI
ncbi:unnamed protein product [Rodentolepis nana]|uniref:Uncharacterized protein n=1 Tax=Rodentolepis nana TaxID=102285 RepID=A0A0R3T3F0_RODNA|nr:unnamed protein product [Rodentolepis nana]